MTTIINLSALAEPVKDTSMPAYMLSYLNDNLARQWLSIKAFAKLHADYAPPSCVSSVLCFGMFGMPTYSYGWIVTQIDWRLISHYKVGRINTKDFLNKLLDVFSFLRDASFSEDLKKTLFDNRENLTSISDLSSLAELTQELIALALLEQAWLARMQFSEETNRKVQYFFDEHRNDSLYIISNTNEMDCRASINYLRTTYPYIDWLDEEALNTALQVPNNELTTGISLTKDGRFKIYGSYTHRAFKTGHADEANMTTDILLEKLVTQEGIDINQATLISQWQGDRNMATTLGIKQVIDSKSYFSPTEFTVINAHVD